MSREEAINAKYQALSLDDIPEFPGLLEYAHHVGSALIRPDDVQGWKKEAIAGKLYDTQKQLDTLEEFMEDALEEGSDSLVTKIRGKAWTLIRNVVFTEFLYAAKLMHIPAKLATYHLYVQKGTLTLSLVGPDEWTDYETYIASALYRPDNIFELTQSNDEVLASYVKGYLDLAYPDQLSE